MRYLFGIATVCGLGLATGLLGCSGTGETAGNLFVTTSTGVQVFDPSGDLWGTIEVPDGRVPANCTFGGADARTLYITAREAVYRVLLANPGLY